MSPAPSLIPLQFLGSRKALGQLEKPFITTEAPNLPWAYDLPGRPCAGLPSQACRLFWSIPSPGMMFVLHWALSILRSYGCTVLCEVVRLQIRVPGAHTERWRTEQTPHSCGCKAGLRRICWALSPVSPLRSRWKWNRTCWMTRCVTSARARAAVGSLPPSSVPMSPVYSTTVNTAGPASTPEPAASSTNRWWRREATALGTSRSAGAERRPGRPSYKYWSRITRRKRGHCLRAHGVLEICAFVLDF